MTKRLKYVTPQTGDRIKSHESDEISPEQQPPIFSFYKISRTHCVSNCTTDEKGALIDKIYRLSQLTWAEIRSTHNKYGLGYEHIDAKTIYAEIPGDIKGEVTFLAFRFYKTAPMVGYRERRIFHIIWLDRDFTLYKH
jgi:hypothetical protein